MANVKYPGKLGQRSHDMPPSRPPTTAFGEPSEEALAEYGKVRDEWVGRQAVRTLDGLMRLLEYYGIKDTEDRFLHLAMALARDHVPYCMVPVRRPGRPKRPDILPAVDAMAEAAKAAGKPKKLVFQTFAKILNVDESTVIREVKRSRATKKGGKKKN